MTEESKVLTPEELEDVAGGYTEYDKNLFTQTRFIFDKYEVEIIKNTLNVTLEADKGYSINELKKLGIVKFAKNKTDVERELANIGLHKF